MPSESEYEEATRNLKACGNKVDYILTHTAPSETILRLNMTRCLNELRLNTFLDYIHDAVEYKHWYFGHFHREGYIWRNQTALFFDMVAIKGKETKNGEQDDDISG